MSIQVLERSAEALRLMEQVLRGGRPLAPEYPLVFGPQAHGRVVLLSEDGQARASCATLVRDLVLPADELRVGLIGSVSTAAQHRGRGLASRTLAAAEDALRAEGCLVALLWADDAGFYARRGYGAVGGEVVVPLEPELERLLPLPSGVREAEPARDAAALHALYVQHRRRVRRSFSETAASLAMPGLRTLVRVRRGEVVAYACEGRGHDLEGVVHEWGGPCEDVLACLAAHLAARRGRGPQGAMFLLAPHAGSELVGRLTRAGALAIPGILAQGKLLDPSAALERIAAHAVGLVESERLDEARWLLSHGRRRVELDLAAVREVLLAPRAERAAVTQLEQGLELPFEGLPLTPFLWGLDSI